MATVDSTYERYEYIDPDSDDALMDSIDPSHVRLGERLNEVQRRSCAQVETVYDHVDIPARRTFVIDTLPQVMIGSIFCKCLHIFVDHVGSSERSRRAFEVTMEEIGPMRL